MGTRQPGVDAQWLPSNTEPMTMSTETNALIERLAREAGLTPRKGGLFFTSGGVDGVTGEDLAHFAALVAAECADRSHPFLRIKAAAIDSVNGDGAKGTENTGPRPSDDSRALPSTKSVAITLTMIAREMRRLTGAKHCQVVRAYDGPDDEFMVQFWADGRWVAMPRHRPSVLLGSLDAFSARVCVPAAEALKLAADGAEPFKAPRGHANYEFAEVRA